MVQTGYINQQQLAEEVQRARLKLDPPIIGMKYSVGPDTSGDPSIFFRIVLTDFDSLEENLARVTGQISTILFDELRPYENWGLIPYFSFRSQSENAARNDPAWP